jgi:hypothetical protein
MPYEVREYPGQYNPPWTIPPFRRNEIIVRIR